MKFLQRFWPWKEVARLKQELAEKDRQLNLLKGCYEASQHQLESAKEKIVENEGHFRKLTRIIAVSAGFGMFALTCLSQPVQRQLLTTNLSAVTQQFGAPGSVVQMTNTAGIAYMSVPHLGIPSAKTNAVIWNVFSKSAGAPIVGIVANQNGNAFYVTGQTNVPGTHVGKSVVDGSFYVIANSSVSDGTLALLLEVDGGDNQPGGFGPFAITPQNLWTNIGWQDSIVIGHTPGYWLIGTNATHAAIQAGILDSTVINLGALPLCKGIQFSTIQEADGSLLACTNVNTSALFGAFFQTLTASTNDVIVSGAGNGWNSYSSGNTFVGGSAVPNSTHGNTNLILGPFIDLPTDGQSFQVNIQNAIWITSAATSGNTAGNTVVQLNGTLSIQSTTNQIRYGATNTAPANTTTPTKWINVTINGEGTQYKMPLYQ